MGALIADAYITVVAGRCSKLTVPTAGPDSAFVAFFLVSIAIFQRTKLASVRVARCLATPTIVITLSATEAVL